MKGAQINDGILHRLCAAATDPTFHNRKYAGKQPPSARSIDEVSRVLPINEISEKHKTRPGGQSPESFFNNADGPIPDVRVTRSRNLRITEEAPVACHSLNRTPHKNDSCSEHRMIRGFGTYHKRLAAAISAEERGTQRGEPERHSNIHAQDDNTCEGERCDSLAQRTSARLKHGGASLG